MVSPPVWLQVSERAEIFLAALILLGQQEKKRVIHIIVERLKPVKHVFHVEFFVVELLFIFIKVSHFCDPNTF